MPKIKPKFLFTYADDTQEIVSATTLDAAKRSARKKRGYLKRTKRIALIEENGVPYDADKALNDVLREIGSKHDAKSFLEGG
jgi:hypothetical protein